MIGPRPLAAYFFGVLTVILILLIYWIVAVYVRPVGNAYANSVCYGIC
jgi:hypothetical protein